MKQNLEPLQSRQTYPQSGAGHHRVSGSMDNTRRNMKSSNL